MRFTSALYRGNSLVWADEQVAGQVLYPNRANFEVIYDVQAPEVIDLEPELLEALRWSANTQGSPVPVALPGGRAPEFSIATATADGTLVDHEGAFDAVAEVLVRREQRKMRRLKFGDRPQIPCALCGRTLPARLIRAAHVKRRSLCTPDEMLDLANIIPACALGCDEMFEHGYLAVDDQGLVTPLRESSGDLRTAVEAVAGRSCDEHTPRSSAYFAWHRADHSA